MSIIKPRIIRSLCGDMKDSRLRSQKEMLDNNISNLILSISYYFFKVSKEKIQKGILKVRM